MSTAPKRGRGRPPIVAGEPGERYQVHLPPSVADKLRAHGGGSLSLGIVKAAARIRRRAPKGRESR